MSVPAELPPLPATVTAVHLRSCAADLAQASTSAQAGARIGELGALTELVQALIAGQELIGQTLANLADRVDEQRATGPLAAAPAAESIALADILTAAASAAGSTAAALAEARPALDLLAGSIGRDTHL